jgi:site-specific DNA-methyltransferase (adenine-specific)
MGEREGKRWRLIRGDCLGLLARIEADAVVTDPPYGIGLQNNDRDGHRRQASYRIAGDENRMVALAVLKWSENRNLPTVAFASPWNPWPGNWRNLIVWDKGGAVGGGGDIATCLKRTWELIQVARNGPMRGGRAESVWRAKQSPHGTRQHIAAKPLSLMRAIIERFTNPGDVVFDPFAGSGSTGVACLQTGRRFIGIEIDPGYCAVARKRLKAAANEVKETAQCPAQASS